MKPAAIYNYKHRHDIIVNAINDCLELMYNDSYPKIAEGDASNFKEIIKHVKEYIKQYDVKPGHAIELSDDAGKKYCYPQDFFYLPTSYQMMIIDNYCEAYNINRVWEDYVDVLIDYIKNEDETHVRDVYVNDERGSHRDYEKIPKLVDAINKILKDNNISDEQLSETIVNKVFEHIDYCKKFYKFGLIDENMFRGGVSWRSPAGNRNTVIEAWKNVFNKNVIVPNAELFVDEYDELNEDEFEEESLEKNFDILK